MPIRWKIVCGVLVLVIFSLLGPQQLFAQAHDVDVAVVVQPDTPVSNLSLAEVRKIFLGERQYWTANTPVVLLIRAPVARRAQRRAENHLSDVGVAVQTVLDRQDLSRRIGFRSEGGLLERYGE
jgi:hypothetical protein